jgi:hypothetical protein
MFKLGRLLGREIAVVGDGSAVVGCESGRCVVEGGGEGGGDSDRDRIRLVVGGGEVDWRVQRVSRGGVAGE